MANAVTRRSFLYGNLAMLAFGESLRSVREAFDHLLLGVSDLDHGIDWFAKRSGVRAALGGVHPGRGTRNALLSLGEAHYLEIIAPDPAQPGVKPQFSLTRREPRLINFAVRTNDVNGVAESLRRAGMQVIGPREGSRRTASGEMLRWKTVAIESHFQSGEINPIPFFIEWASDSTHPSKDAPGGCRIEGVRFEHPRANELAATFRAMGLEAEVGKAEQVRIMARVQTPIGFVELS